jgi:hypothetical protein
LAVLLSVKLHLILRSGRYLRCSIIIIWHSALRNVAELIQLKESHLARQEKASLIRINCSGSHHCRSIKAAAASLLSLPHTSRATLQVKVGAVLLALPGQTL